METRIEKHVQWIALHAPANESDYWLTRTPQERLAAIEQLREDYFSFHPDVPRRLPRVYAIVKRPRS